jgi:hypothetical protein
MENIGVSMDGSQVVAVKDLGLDYNVFQMLARGLSVDSIRLDKPVVYLRREGDTWSLSRLVKKQEQEADREGPARPISIDAIELTDGEVVIDQPVGTSGVTVPKRFEHLDAKLSFTYEPVRYSIEITQLSFRGQEPALAVNALSGGVAVKDDTLFIEKLALRTAESSLLVDGAVQHYLSKPQFNLQINSKQLSLPEFAQIVPALAGVKLQPAFEFALNGPMDRLDVAMNVRSSAGQVNGKVVADLWRPDSRLTGDLSRCAASISRRSHDPKQKSDITRTPASTSTARPCPTVDSLRGHAGRQTPARRRGRAMPRDRSRQGPHRGRRVALDAKWRRLRGDGDGAGNVTLPDLAKDAPARTLAFDLNGQLRHIELRKMPGNLDIRRPQTESTPRIARPVRCDRQRHRASATVR